MSQSYIPGKTEGTMEMKCVPIVLFVFNRLDHTKRAVEALLKNK